MNLSASDLAFALDRIERRAFVYTQKRDEHARVLFELSLSIRDAERLTEILAAYNPRRTKGRIRIRGVMAEALIDDLAPHFSPALRERALAALARAREARAARAAARVNDEDAA